MTNHTEVTSNKFFLLKYEIMNLPFELLLPRRPLSHQAKNSTNKQAWKDFIYGRAFAIWKHTPISNRALCFTLVYLCESDPCDINNVIKPIQDALNTLFYSDDSLICDISAHMRLLSEPIDIVGLPELLQEAIIRGTVCVYIRVTESFELNLGVKL